MKSRLSYILLIRIVACLLFMGIFYFAPKSQAAVNLIKIKESATIYYLDDQGGRHPFPNELTYKSWYGNDFSKISTVSADFLASQPLGKNITVRPGKYLVKVPSSPQVYAVEQGGLLRPIASEDIAKAIYGKNWAKKVIDIPEVFFQNYIIGELLKHDYELPDNIVYKLKDESKYYWKANRVLQPFKSADAVLANGYELTDVIEGGRFLYSRTRPIEGKSNTIFNPVTELAVKKFDCENKNLKAAVIFLSQGEHTVDQVDKIQKIKSELPAYYAWATSDLSAIDVNWPTAVYRDDGYFFETSRDGTVSLNNEFAFTFYDSNPDIFDFLIVFSNFNIQTDDEIATFLPVTNNVSGTGKAILDASEIFGSTGKLKGIIVMGNINKFNPAIAVGSNEAQNYLVHEILHQWSGAIKFLSSDNKLSDKLLRSDGAHWSYYDGFISPLGGSGWQDNSDGTFTSKLSQMADTNLRPYATIDLYLMGLLPAITVPPIIYLEPAVIGQTANTLKATAKSVSINQIIEANGKWQCEE